MGRKTGTEGSDHRSASLYVGTIIHHRYLPRVHRLRYRFFSIMLDLDRLERCDSETRWFSRNRFNLYSFVDADHGPGNDAAMPRSLAAYARELVRRAGVDDPVARITLSCMPRVLGYVFNPLSVYYCYDAHDVLLALVYEVNNTFGQRHTYVIAVDEQTRNDVQTQHKKDTLVQRCAKAFHVSPFLGRDLRYTFRVRAPHERLFLSIHVGDADGTPMMDAMHDARRTDLNDKALLRLFVTHPMLTLKVVLGIHWEALRIWLKGAEYRPCPAPGPAVTIVSRTRINHAVERFDGNPDSGNRPA